MPFHHGSSYARGDASTREVDHGKSLLEGTQDVSCESNASINGRLDIPIATTTSTTLSFHGVSFAVGKRKSMKIILRNISATVCHGHVLAIMGPSGAGKSTLINALTQDSFYGTALGTVTLNGLPMSSSIFKRHCYVVKQRDTNWSNLTARETLSFAAELFDLPNEIDTLVHEILGKTGLLGCADIQSARLSGGQQRRLSLAVALLKQPAVLFLDEPTSGLDAAAASSIMREITRVAKEERIAVICTIHQPSSKVYNGFDQLMLLSRGREAYVGNAKETTAYFGSIGYPLPPETNPAEHFIDLVNADFSSVEEVDSILDTWEEKRSIDFPPARVADGITTQGSLIDKEQKHRIFRQSTIMIRRHALLMVRDPVLYAGRLLGFLLVNCLFGVVYIAARDYTQDQTMNKLWVSGWYIGVPSNMAVVAVYKLNSEIRSIWLENKNGIGSPVSYIIAKTLMVCPVLVMFTISAIGIPGYLIQAFPPSTFVRLSLLWIAQISMWECSAEAIAALFNDAILGMLIQAALWFGALLFSGYLVPVEDMFWPLKAFYYVLPYNYYIRSAMYLIFTESTWEPCTDPTASAVCVDSSDGFAVLDAFSRVFPLVTTEYTYWSDIAALFLLSFFWKVVGVVTILAKSRRVSPIRSPKTNHCIPSTDRELETQLGKEDDKLDNDDDYNSDHSVEC